MIHRMLVSACAVVAVAVLPTVAFAEDVPAPTQSAVDPSPDTIYLRGGGLLRGRVLEIVPGDHAVVVLVTGEQKRVTWPEVDHIVVGTPPADAAQQPERPAGPPPMIGPRVRVVLHSSKPSYLHRRAQGTADFVQVCESPCNVEVPLGDTYKIGGSGITTTKEFRLEGKPGSTVDITVDGPNWFGIVSGGLMTIAGGVSLYIGTLLSLAGSSAGRDASGIRDAGLAALGIGAGLVGLGLLIVIPSTKTDLVLESSAAPKDAYVRKPVWHTASSRPELPVPSGSFPLLFEQRF